MWALSFFMFASWCLILSLNYMYSVGEVQRD